MTVPDAGTAVTVAADPSHLGRSLRSGLFWSLLNNMVSRLGSFLAGIVVARLLVPEDFGVYAVALVVLNIALSANELGVSVAVVQRRGSLDDVAPTVTTICVASSAVLAGLGVAAAGPLASAMGSASAAGVVRLMMVAILLDGLVSVPNALITRAFAQKTRMRIDLIAFATGTPLTIGLAVAGFGAWSLGWGAVVGNVVAAVLVLRWAPARYRPGWNAGVAREVLRFGLPLGGSSLLLLVLVNVGQIVVGRELGTVQLGLYLLAFNLCSWPISVVSAALRRVTLAAFSRMAETGQGPVGFVRVATLVLAVTVPACVFLAAYAEPVIEVVYGRTWLPAAAALQWLALFSIGRIAVELVYDYLTAVGRTVSSAWLYVVWLVALVPALVVGARQAGIAGVGVAQALVVAIVVVPVLLVVVRRAGVGLLALARSMVLPLVGVVVLVASVVVVRAADLSAWLELGAGVGGLLLYATAVSPLRRQARDLWSTSGQV